MRAFVEAARAAAERTAPLRSPMSRRGRFGPYGGAYVPETVVPALAELEAAMDDGARGPRRSSTSWRACCTTTRAGRPR